MDAASTREPRLGRTIRHLFEEHNQLRQSVNELIAKGEAASTVDDSLRDEIVEWVETIREHELRENDLIQDSFYLDLGTKD